MALDRYLPEALPICTDDHPIILVVVTEHNDAIFYQPFIAPTQKFGWKPAALKHHGTRGD